MTQYPLKYLERTLHGHTGQSAGVMFAKVYLESLYAVSHLYVSLSILYGGHAITNPAVGWEFQTLSPLLGIRPVFYRGRDSSSGLCNAPGQIFGRCASPQHSSLPILGVVHGAARLGYEQVLRDHSRLPFVPHC